MKKKKIHWIQLLSMAFIVGLFIIFVINLNIQADLIQVGDEAPDFELEALNGDVYQLAAYQDKPIVLYFFTTWCSSCKTQTPEMIQFQEEFEDVHVLTIVRSESKRAVEKYIEKTGHTENQYLFDFNSEVSDRYGVVGQPETIIINEAGNVVDHTVGPLTRDSLVEKMENLVY